MKRKSIAVAGVIGILAMSAGGAILMSLPGSVNQIAVSDTSGIGRFLPGERVVLLDNDPLNGLGLEAGRSGTVLCCDTSDCSGSILVSWDLWTDGKADGALYTDAMNSLYPAASAVWVNPNRVRIGHPFKQCGILRKGLEGCVYFEADDGNLYNVVCPGSLYAVLDAGIGPIYFDTRVQIQGLLNTTPAAPGDVRPCSQLDGDVFHAVASPCPGGSQGLPDPITISLAGNPLHLVPDPNSLGPDYTYDGCTSITLKLNFQAKLSMRVTPASGVGGSWMGTVTPDVVGPGTATVHICIHVEHLDISTLPAGNMQVAAVTLSAVPAM